MYFRHIDDSSAGLADSSAGAHAPHVRQAHDARWRRAHAGRDRSCTQRCRRVNYACRELRRFATPFVRIAPDNTVTVIVKHVEAGQGVWTGLSAVVAEELDARWSQMRAESPRPRACRCTAISLSIPRARCRARAARPRWPIRGISCVEAGATARAMLVAAAAQRWKVPAARDHGQRRRGVAQLGQARDVR